MAKNQIDIHTSSEATVAVAEEPTTLQTGPFPTLEAHQSSSQRWKKAAALLAAGGLLTACGGLGTTPGGYKGPFGLREATHLLRRAAGRGTAAEAKRLAEMGLKRAVDHLLAEPHLPKQKDPGDFVNGGYVYPSEFDYDWTHLWLSTPTPAAERLTLFWHGHFVTEANKPSAWVTYVKINKLREKSLSSFGDLLYTVAEDAAMMVYLDNNTSTKDHPNENWARELMELFTLGVGHYTEHDIQEIARAFTGWGTKRDPVLHNNWVQYFEFHPDDHDPKPKTVFGQRVHRPNREEWQQEGFDVLDLILARDQTYRFIAEKLLKYYYRPNPDQQMINAGADILKRGTVRDFLKWLFTHPSFYADETRNALVKSPFEWVVGLLYALGWRGIPDTIDPNFDDYTLVWNWYRKYLGYDPYNPPDVSGWPVASLEWLDDSASLRRLNFIKRAIDDVNKNRANTHPEPEDFSVFVDGGTDYLSLLAPEAQLL